MSLTCSETKDNEDRHPFPHNQSWILSCFVSSLLPLDLSNLAQQVAHFVTVEFCNWG